MSGAAAVNHGPTPPSLAWACFNGFGRTIFTTDGAVKVSKLVKEIFRILAELQVNMFTSLAAAVNWFSGFGDVIEGVNRTYQVIAKPATDWAESVAGIFYAAFRALIAGYFLERLGLINIAAICAAIGNVPVLKYVLYIPSPVDTVGSISAVFDITHHSMQIHYKIDLEAKEYQHAYKRLNAQDNLMFNREKDEYADKQAFMTHAKAHIETRIALSKEPSMSDEALTERVENQWKAFKQLVDLEKTSGFNDTDRGIRKYVADKIVFEKNKFETWEKFVKDNATTKRVRSVISIAYDVSKLMLFVFYIAVSVWSISFLAATAPFVLGFSLLSAALGVARVAFGVVYNFKVPKYEIPKSIEKVEKDIATFVKGDKTPEDADDDRRKDIATKAQLYRELIEIR